MKRAIFSRRSTNTSTKRDFSHSLNLIEIQKLRIVEKLEEYEKKFTVKQFRAQQSLIELEEREVVLL